MTKVLHKKLYLIILFIIVVCVVLLGCTTTLFFDQKNNVVAASGDWTSNYEAFTTSTTVDNKNVVVGKSINIYKEEHLAYIAWYVNNDLSSPFAKGFNGYTIKLQSGMHLGSHFWIPIGSYTSDSNNHPLKASFDGNNCIIYGLTLSGTYDGEYLSFIGYTTGNVSNVCMYGVSFPTEIKHNVSCVVGLATGNITHCQTYSRFERMSGFTLRIMCTGTSPQYVAAICSYFKGSKISDCNNLIPISLENETDSNGNAKRTNNNIHFISVCGICAYVENGEVSECINQGQIGNDYSEYYHNNWISCGICMIASGTVKNCENNRSIEGELYAFGIAYSYPETTIYNCSNFAGIGSIYGSFGICYKAKEIYNCYNKGGVSNGGYIYTSDYKPNAAGICYYISSKITNCINDGIIEAYVQTGGYNNQRTSMCGIVIYAAENSKIEYCKNNGKVMGGPGVGAGIILEYKGSYDNRLNNLKNCYDSSGSSGYGSGQSSYTFHYYEQENTKSLTDSVAINKTNAGMDNEYHLKFTNNTNNYINKDCSNGYNSSTIKYKLYKSGYWEYNTSTPTVG